jgi:hypothetical protein
MHGVTTDSAGNLYVVGRAAITGETDSSDYPQVSPVAAPPTKEAYASFLSVLNPTAAALDFSNYLYAGAFPFVTAVNNWCFGVAGSAGTGAQTSQSINSYGSIPVAPDTKGYLAIVYAPPQ